IFDFVGNENHLPWGADESNLEFDSDHEGHGGWRSDQISYNIESWVKLNTPDIVLFHIGTNDLAQGYSPSHVIEHIGKTIEILRLYNPDIIIFVAQIIPYDLEVNVSQSDYLFGGLELTFLVLGLLMIGEVIRKNYFKDN
ncbi:MAG: GDSL-type esterase/lipase family protein, partial [Candidatus Thermoplasmatota archaeon]|nr:GDSL-type esterase/lipase family protein [Candidatus Thermoplasmatota archaeon]